MGETIEIEEREQFGLFYGIDNFKAATFYGIKGGGYEVEIITEHEKLVAVNRDSLAIKILRDYIDRYEEIKESRTEFEKKWNIVDCDYLGQPITEYEVNMAESYSCYAAGCVLGSGILALYPSFILGYVAGGGDFTDFEVDNPTVVLITFVAAMATNIIIGALIGRKIDKNKVLKTIKKARKPRVVE